jgi:hypothetical protein
MQNSHHFINRRGLDSKTNLTSQFFIEMPGPNQENERSCICVVGIGVLAIKPRGLNKIAQIG